MARDGVGDALHALRLHRALRLAPAEHHRRDEHPHLVDLARLEEHARQVRAALEQERLDLARPELVERGAHAGGLVLAAGHDHLDARVAQARRWPCAWRRASRRRSRAPRRRSRTSCESERRGWPPSRTPPARGWLRDALDPRGEQRVVVGGGVDARRPPRRTRRASGGRGRGWTRRRSTASRRCAVATLPSSVIADLKTTSGRPVRACLRKGWLSRRAASATSPSHDVDRDRPRRAGSPARGPRPSRWDRRRRRPRGRSRPRRSRRCRAASGPRGSTARATRTGWPRRGPPRTRPARHALGVRLAGPRRGTPRRCVRSPFTMTAPDERVRRGAARAQWRPARWPVVRWR